jgi:subtilase family serine protease
MKKRISLVAGLLILLATVHASALAQGNNPKLEVKKPIPDVLLPDLTIPNVTIDDIKNYSGTVKVRVSNTGKGASTGCKLRVTPMTGEPMDFDVPELASGGNTIVSFTYDTKASGSFKTIVVDPDNKVKESKENNNRWVKNK